MNIVMKWAFANVNHVSMVAVYIHFFINLYRDARRLDVHGNIICIKTKLGRKEVMPSLMKTFQVSAYQASPKLLQEHLIKCKTSALTRNIISFHIVEISCLSGRKTLSQVKHFHTMLHFSKQCTKNTSSSPHEV